MTQYFNKKMQNGMKFNISYYYQYCINIRTHNYITIIGVFMDSTFNLILLFLYVIILLILIHSQSQYNYKAKYDLWVLILIVFIMIPKGTWPGARNESWDPLSSTFLQVRTHIDRDILIHINSLADIDTHLQSHTHT